MTKLIVPARPKLWTPPPGALAEGVLEHEFGTPSPNTQTPDNKLQCSVYPGILATYNGGGGVAGGGGGGGGLVLESTNTNRQAISVGTTFDADLPSGIVSGDLLVIIFCETDGYYGDWIGTTSRDLTPPTGWTYFDGQATGSINPSYLIWYREADGTEGATAQFTATGTPAFASYAFRFSGADNASPFDTIIEYSATVSNAQIPPCTSSTNDAIVLFGLITNSSANYDLADTNNPDLIEMPEYDESGGSFKVGYYQAGEAGIQFGLDVDIGANRIVRAFQVAVKAAS